MTKGICEVVENTHIHFKTITILRILENNHELNSIVVNKGQIHGELRYFLFIL